MKHDFLFQFKFKNQNTNSNNDKQNHKGLKSEVQYGQIDFTP